MVENLPWKKDEPQRAQRTQRFFKGKREKRKTYFRLFVVLRPYERAEQAPPLRAYTSGIKSMWTINTLPMPR